MQKKTPERRCTGCGETLPKSELIRVVRDPEGEISVDLAGKKSGRGAYICNKKECLAKAKKTRRLESSLKCSISEDIYLKLEKQITEGSQNE